MGRGKFPEVRSMIEFDRLAKNHIIDAYSQLVPSLKRIIRQRSTSENQLMIPQQVQQPVSSEENISGINSSAAEKLALFLSPSMINTSSVSGDSPTFNEPQLKQREAK
ncbi:MAG: hypothetical protein H0U75_00420 [Legionella sp.]|nr:hypothetical protein [Legionella sp.]